MVIATIVVSSGRNLSGQTGKAAREHEAGRAVTAGVNRALNDLQIRKSHKAPSVGPAFIEPESGFQLIGGHDVDAEMLSNCIRGYAKEAMIC